MESTPAWMRIANLINFFLPLAEADLHYLHARTAGGYGRQGGHDELAVRYCLLGVGHIRLRQHDNARRRLLFASSLAPSFGDPRLLLASLATPASGDRRSHLDAAAAAVPDCLSPSRVDELLWLLGVPRARREVVAAKGPLTHECLELLAWAIECEGDDERTIAQGLLVTGHKRLGLGAVVG